VTLVDELHARIAESGPLSFAEVMAAALYHPRFGYYTRLRGFGAEGDFVTSPELHPIFGFLLARQVEDVWRALGEPEPLRILEIGGGSGALAESLLRGLRLRVSYVIDETSPSLRSTQQRRLSGLPVGWTAAGEKFHVVLANEVLDAQPVVRLTVRGGQLRELRVDHDFTWVETQPPPEAEAYFQRLGFLPPEGAIADVNLGLTAWVEQTSVRLADRGLLLVLDYGYPAESLFTRTQGTLLTYFHHTLGSDPLVRLGQQDISVHVDFSTLARAAHQAGLDVLGVTSQRTLLRNLGVEPLLRPLRSPEDRRAVEQLLDPHGLGRIGALFAAKDTRRSQDSRRMSSSLSKPQVSAVGLQYDGDLTAGFWDATSQTRTLRVAQAPSDAGAFQGYVPVGLVGGHDWRPSDLPTLDTRDDFLDQWREAFAEEEAPTCR
jgi:SAM-dependent MidA family methyltransferase